MAYVPILKRNDDKSKMLLGGGIMGLFLGMLLLVSLVYIKDTSKILPVFVFCVYTLILFSYNLFVPVLNFFLLPIVPELYNFILDTVGIAGDSFTLYFSWVILILYITLNILMTIATLLLAIGMKLAAHYIEKQGMMKFLEMFSLYRKPLRK